MITSNPVTVVLLDNPQQGAILRVWFMAPTSSLVRTVFGSPTIREAHGRISSEHGNCGDSGQPPRDRSASSSWHQVNEDGSTRQPCTQVPGGRVHRRASSRHWPRLFQGGDIKQSHDLGMLDTAFPCALGHCQAHIRCRAGSPPVKRPCDEATA